VNGLAPGQAGYLKAGLTQASIVFSTLSSPPSGFSTTTLNKVVAVPGGKRLAFYLVSNNTADAFLAGKVSESAVILGPTFGASSFRQLQTSQSSGVFTLNWEDQPGGGDRSFNNLVLTVQTTQQGVPTGSGLQSRPQGEVLDLRGVNGSVQAQFTVNRDAAFNDVVGFYQVTGLDGGIDTNGDGVADVLPGAANYTRTAIQQRVTAINLKVDNQATATASSPLTGGGIFAPFLIANGTVDLLLDSNVSNDPAVYFPFLAANADGADHIRLLGSNTFGFEDLVKGGDLDYNDMVVRVTFA